MKRIGRFFFSPSRPISSSSSTSLEASPPSSLLHSPSKPMMNKTIRNAKEIINRWDPDTSTHAQVTSLFYGSKIEALDFVKCVGELHTAMHSMISLDSSSGVLIRAQRLMHIAMKRLEKEFSQILSSNRDHLDPESISGRSSLTSRSSISSDYEGSIESTDDIQVASNSITEVENEAAAAMSDLRMIADCMISCGYGKECVEIYKTIRKSIVDEGLFHLGIQPINPKRIHKMDWEVIQLKIKNWLTTVNVAVKTLFCGERILCDYLFSSSNSIKEVCFSEISRGAALSLFQFPELVAVKTKRQPERIFRVLDLYSTISNLWQEIESIFSFESTSVVRSQALSSIIKLGESVRKMLTKFESAIQKDSSTTPVRGGGIHPLTEHVMDYLSSLADYSKILPDILTDWKLPIGTSLPDSSSSISVRFAWFILILLSKLDLKAELYKDVSLSYLFLANNLQFIVTRVRRSNLQFILGEDWISNQEANVKQ